MYLSKVAFSERVRTLNSGGDAQILSDPTALGVVEATLENGSVLSLNILAPPEPAMDGPSGRTLQRTHGFCSHKARMWMS